MYQLSAKSLRNLEGVHPDLVRLAKRAIKKTEIDFGVSEGVRTYERQVQLMEMKKTTTLRSKHLIQRHTGYAHAIDIFAYLNGKAVWENKYYRPIIQTFITEAIALGVQLEFGHLWLRFQDSVHIQLNSKYY